MSIFKKIEIVEFPNGKYAVRKSFMWFFYSYLSLEVDDYCWWGHEEFIVKYSMGTLNECQKKMKCLPHGKGVPVKFNDN